MASDRGLVDMGSSYKLIYMLSYICFHMMTFICYSGSDTNDRYFDQKSIRSLYDFRFKNYGSNGVLVTLTLTFILLVVTQSRHEVLESHMKFHYNPFY